MVCILLYVTISIASSSIVPGCLAWQGMLPASNRRNQSYRRGHQSSSSPPQRVLCSTTNESSPPSAGSSFSPLEGVRDFESWFSGVDGSKCNPYIRHTSFGELRGLGILDKSIGSDSSGSWMTIPRSITLESDFSQTDWDVKLAESLWKELVKGSSSSVKGYVSLLTKSWTTNDLPKIPPFSAPNALRHWSDEEKEVLSTQPEGQALLDLQKRQEQTWRDKYEAVKVTSGSCMTWEQFEWAMEAVHSRAFCGDFGIGGGSSLPNVVNIGAPAAAALAGYAYYVPFHGQNDAILLVLAALGAIPVAINLLRESPPMAVLLPLIDSANHMEEADSSIEYSPLTDSFNLNGGPGCLLKEDDGTQQLIFPTAKSRTRNCC